MANLFTQHIIEEHADSLANYLPGGRLFNGGKVTDTNLRKLLVGLSGELFTAEGYLKTVSNEYDINTTTLFIEEWEGALGIPDSCLKGTGDITQRRRDVLTKLAALGVQTKADFEAVALIFGLIVDVRPGVDVGAVFPLTFPTVLFDTSEDARFTIVVDFTVEGANQFPLTFPFTFGDDIIAILECLFLKLKPANCNVLFRQL